MGSGVGVKPQFEQEECKRGWVELQRRHSSGALKGGDPRGKGSPQSRGYSVSWLVKTDERLGKRKESQLWVPSGYE